MHVMLDLETMGTRLDAAIIQIGAVMFEARSGGRMLNGQGFNRHVLLQDGQGTLDHSTLCFWLREASAAKMGKALSEDALPLSIVLREFKDWPEKCGTTWGAVEGVWAMPADFDLPILKSAFARLWGDVPWDRRDTRCARTLFSLVGGKPTIDWTGMTPHDAFDDAVGQALQVQKAMALLGNTP